MTEVHFIKLFKPGRAKYLCDIAEEYFDVGKKVLITVVDENQAVTLDQFMWTWKRGAFLPHAYDNGAVDCLFEPVIIETKERNPNSAHVLLMGRPCSLDFVSQFELAVDFAEMYDESLAQAARGRFAEYRKRGFDAKMRE